MVDTRWSIYRLVAVAVSWLIRPTPAPVGRSQSWPSTLSISSSLVSGSLKPPRAKNLMPLSGMGLWDAEITAPISTFSTEVRYATPGVGIMPASITSNPPADMPADSAAARKSPETRVSRPTSARRRPSNSLLSPSSPSTRTAASPKSNASCAVKALFANPRTPSVPNIRGMSLKSSLSQVILPCTIVLNGFTIQRNNRQHVAIPANHSMQCREISTISSFLQSHSHPPIPTDWAIMGPKDPLSITVMGPAFVRDGLSGSKQARTGSEISHAVSPGL